jgi:hypothetical protein
MAPTNKLPDKNDWLINRQKLIRPDDQMIVARPGYMMVLDASVLSEDEIRQLATREVRVEVRTEG